MSRNVLAPLAAALSALLVVPQLQAESTAPLFVVEQQRSSLVSRLAKQWSDAFALLPKERRLDHEQLSSALFALRADRLFAVTLAGDAEAIEAVLGEAQREAAKPPVAGKALGDPLADLTYMPLTPCRIADTRIGGGALAPNVTRTFVGYTTTTFVGQGGDVTACGIPDRVAALAMSVYAVNPTTLGFIRLWPANQAEPTVSTVNYQPPLVAIATGAIVPVDDAASNAFNAKSPGTVDLIVDVVGYFRAPIAPGAGLRITRDAIVDTVNAINGSSANAVTPGVRGATVAGGGSPPGDSDPDFQFEGPNEVRDHYGTVGGGLSNRVGDGSGSASDRALATIAGGFANVASGYTSTIAGGGANVATGNWSTIGGGSANRAFGHRSTVSGGADNIAAGDHSWAGGRRAKTQSADVTPISHAGAFAWADSSDVDFNTISPDEFAVRSTGGVRFVTAIDGTGGPAWTCGVSGSAGGSWSCSSDRDLKTALIPLDGVLTLERLATLPVYQWVAKGDPRRTPHAGPTAQDFMAAFGLGDNDKMIGFADAQGIAFAAIQGLNAKLEERLAEKDREIAELKRAVQALLVRALPDGRVGQSP